MGARAFDGDGVAFLLGPALGRHVDHPRTFQVLPGEALGGLHNLLGCPRRDQMAAVNAGARAYVDHMIGRPDGVFIVFDDDHRIAQVPEPDQCFQKPSVVALMEADGRFVQDIEDTCQPRTNLRGQADALAFATG